MLSAVILRVVVGPPSIESGDELEMIRRLYCHLGMRSLERVDAALSGKGSNEDE